MKKKSLQLASLTLPIGSLDAYIYQVNQIPLLSAEEEHQYALRFQKEEDIESARKLVLAHLRYVVSVARGYIGYGLSLSDLIQEGSVGLMKAVKRFDPNMGVRLVSFAVHWIKAEIHEFVLRNWRIVKVATTKAQRKLFFNLRKKKNKLGWMTRSEVDMVAKNLGVSHREVLKMEECFSINMDVPYDAFSLEEEDESYKAPAEYLYNSADDPAYVIEKERGKEVGRESLQVALARLDARSQDILEQRWLAENKATLHDLAHRYGVSAERIRQLEKNAMKKLKEYMEGH